MRPDSVSSENGARESLEPASEPDSLISITVNDRKARCGCEVPHERRKSDV
jgi:hypothetical protein